VSPSLIKSKIEYDLKHKHYKEKTIPVYAGADRPFINYQKELKDDEIFDSYNYETTDYSVFDEEAKKNQSESDINTKISNMASVKIAELIRTHEKRINILTLGPLTNISLAVLVDFSIRDKLKNLYLIGGSYNNLGNSGNSSEYNFRVDPVAAKNVIHYFKNITLIPLEVEEQIKSGGLDLFTIPEKYEVLRKFVTHLSEETEESRSRHSFLGLFGALIAANPKCHKLIVKRPTDVDIIGRFTRGSLAIEKYDHLKSGKFFEINIIEEGGDYGWPFVSYGQPYGGGDYVRPEKTGSHAGYFEPIKYWVPSIAPTELVQLPEQGWGSWGRSLVLGTLREQVLVFIKINDKLVATEDLQVDMGDRIRDLEVLSNGALLATTDSGKLITIRN